MTAPIQRIARMRREFAKKKSLLAADYEYFITRHASTPQNKAGHKSAERRGRQSPKPSETLSSDKSDG
jgi:hypothetical protein